MSIRILISTILVLVLLSGALLSAEEGLLARQIPWLRVFVEGVVMCLVQADG